MRFLRAIWFVVLLFLLLIFGLISRIFTRQSKAKYLDQTLRLYDQSHDVTSFVWIYEIEDRIYVDAGEIGKFAERANYPLENWEEIKAHIDTLRDQGFGEIDDDDMEVLQIVFEVAQDFADSKELDKRNALMDKLDELFALTGLGWWCDASSGMGTMELGFMVVDFEVAKRTVTEHLQGTEFDNYIIRPEMSLATIEQLQEEAAHTNTNPDRA